MNKLRGATQGSGMPAASTAVKSGTAVKWGAAIGAFALAAATAGCQSDTAKATGTPSAADPSASAEQSPTGAASATLAFAPANGAAKVRADAPVSVKAAGGTLSTVVAKGADGTVVKGALSADKATWTATSKLPYNTTVAVTATGVNQDGQQTTSTAKFTTIKPAQLDKVSMMPRTGSTVGIAMPVFVYFDKTVTNKAAVEKALKVTSSVPVEGSWSWTGKRTVVYRTAKYWPAGTKVHVNGDLTGVELSPGVWGDKRDPVDFTVGRAQITTTDISGHTLTVQRDGATLKTIPVTTGKPGLATREGIKVIMTQESERTMDAETTGVSKDDPDYYRLNVKWAQRITNSGEFFHAAPWSVWAQGKQNVSHGCTGMSTSNALWLMENSLVGDPAVFVNGSRKLESGNGWTMWNESYDQWKAGSALK